MSGEKETLYPLVSDPGNERVLREWIDDHDSYTVADTDRSVAAGEFDLCIVDADGLETNREKLLDAKTASRPVLLPVLLLLSEDNSEIIAADRGEVADNVLRSTVDEVVSLPMRQAELEWRIEALFRLRKQSLDLQAKAVELRRFRQAVEASGHAIFITDPDGVIEYANPAFEEITGYSRSEILGQTPSVLQSGETSTECYEGLWETIQEGSVWRGEIVDRRKDGEIYNAFQTIAPITDDADEIEAFVAVQTDITERKELQDRLGRHRDIVQRLEDPIMLQDETGGFELVNEALVEFAGLSESELLDEDEHRFMDGATAETIERKKQRVLETEESVRYSVSPTFEKSDEEATFDTSRYPYYDDDGELSGTIAICRDVTELEERTRQLRVIDNVLRHNLRNDLTVVRGLAEQIRSEADGDLADAADRIHTQATKLITTGEKSRAITDLLTEDPTPATIDVAASVRSVAEEVADSEPDARIDVEAPDSAVAETTFRIPKAIEELARNAIVHNDREEPSVAFRVGITGESVTISVVDDGPGIPEMDRDVLLTGQAIDDLYHGSGLGLWLVYWIVKRSNGSVDVSDVEPRGSEVAITLPRERDDPT